jgi:hypothetical protein
MDQITRDKTSIAANNHHTTLVGLQRPTISERRITKSRCKNLDEIYNFSQLKPDDLAFLTILFQILDKNLSEYDNILHDIVHIGGYIAESNKKNFIFNNQQLFLQQNRLKLMMNTLSINSIRFV